MFLEIPNLQIVVMASGPLPPGGTHTGLKLFVYAVGRTRSNAEVSFLAQVGICVKLCYCCGIILVL